MASVTAYALPPLPKKLDKCATRSCQRANARGRSSPVTTTSLMTTFAAYSVRVTADTANTANTAPAPAPAPAGRENI
ncbi:hypothetical protein CTA1_10827 [Colletotrichum tanaceti]|uniref:Uncharacterized protein n=1 Tax=Colletotrichum tanaceti TaxID=1306861 RepID=A0A4U6WYW6_9PEZI|nr:hypothetical protein CTA1_10827 [Colletotrichum tanaceti]